MMFRWWSNWQDRKRLAQEDAAILIARFGVRASHMAKRRVILMRRRGARFQSSPCHWKRVYSIARQLLPYDGSGGQPSP
jgi:hypothetical protein